MTAITAFIGIAALIWGFVLMRFGGLLLGCLGVLLIGTVLGPPFFTYHWGPLPLTADRLLLVVVAGCYLVSWSRGRGGGKPIGWADLLLGALLGALTLSTFTHDWSINDAQPVSNLVFYYLAPAALYWLTRQSQLGDRQLAMAFACFSLLGIYLAATAVAEVRQIWWLVHPKYIASPDIHEFFGRGRGPLLNPVGGGLFMIAGLAGVGMFWPGRSSSAGQLKQRGKQFAVLAAGAVVLAGIYCTLTRSIWLAGGAVVLLIIGHYLPRSARPAAAVAAVLFAAALLATKWESLRAFKRDQHVSAHEMSQSAGLRPVLATVAWKMFLDRPLLGCGLGQYKEVDVDYLRDPSSNLPLERAMPYEQHSVFLALLTETGIVGASLYVALLAFWARDAWRLYRGGDGSAQRFALLFLAFLFAFVCNGLLHDLTVIPMVHMLLFALAGISRGLVANQLVTNRCGAPTYNRRLEPAT